ncbi:toll/interleukin-1 receptor domain-containing protein [Cobetia sp. MMG027]|uniref:toll/interleukin-1 receptor domain-containing protein n=1 Tax=Cobetia sp. MMG027 TaxID=3021980 RepID=UPI0022FF15E9|nr:toll/interleukin-1 receptor domain-containing protein [Cobetia sp. MMG027]MDA5564403.1 toll/interleukin-1 receptor domain-containing protein [Cobetia sp. MMG027]
MKTVFLSYSHDDEAFRNKLESHLSLLRRQNIIEVWHDRKIDAGSEFNEEINHHVRNDDIVVILVSPSFLASDYCYDVELNTALERHCSNDAVVIPVIVRPCDWHSSPFGNLMATPTDGKAITLWDNEDSALLQVATAIKKVASK